MKNDGVEAIMVTCLILGAVGAIGFVEWASRLIEQQEKGKQR